MKIINPSMLLQVIKKYKKAVFDYGMAIEGDSSDTVCYLRRGVFKDQYLGQHRSAVEDFTNLLKITPQKHFHKNSASISLY